MQTLSVPVCASVADLKDSPTGGLLLRCLAALQSSVRNRSFCLRVPASPSALFHDSLSRSHHTEMLQQKRTLRCSQNILVSDIISVSLRFVKYFFRKFSPKTIFKFFLETLYSEYYNKHKEKKPPTKWLTFVL